MAKRKARQTPIQLSRHVSPSQKAAFHQVTGAGKNHVLRQFFGLSESDMDALAARFGQGLDQLLTAKT